MTEYIDLQTVEESMVGKIVHVVGNARSIFDHKNGEEIDSGDVIIRMNMGLPVNEKRTLRDSIGIKTDILAGCCFPPEEDWIAAGRPIIWYRTLNQVRPNYSLAQYFNYLGFWEQIERDGLPRASTGCRILEILVRRMEEAPEEIRVFGMDHFETPTWYRGGDASTPHDGPAEETFILEKLGFIIDGATLSWPIIPS